MSREVRKEGIEKNKDSNLEISNRRDFGRTPIPAPFL